MKRSWVVSIVMLLASMCSAADQRTPGSAKVVAPFVNEGTVCVAHIDLASLDLAAVEEWLGGQIKVVAPEEKEAAALTKKMKEILAPPRKWIEDFKAAGGKDVYLVVGLLEEKDQEPLPFYVVPAMKGAKIEAFEALFQKLGSGPAGESGMEAKLLNGSVVACQKGWMAKVEKMQPAANASLEPALAAGAGKSVQFVLAPGAWIRQMKLDDLADGLPKEFDLAGTLAAFRWASVGLELPPKPALQVVLQGTDAAGAKKLNDMAVAAIKLLAGQPGMEKMAAALTPKLEGDRLTTSLDSDQVAKLVSGTVAPALTRARQQAMRVASLSNERQLIMACMMYAQDNNGQWPDELGQLKDKYIKSDHAFHNPAQPDRKDGYVYLKPRANAANAGETIVVHEAFDKWPGGVNVGFLDGHCEYVGDEAAFNKLLAAVKGK